MKVFASTKYGLSYVWGDPEPFDSIRDVIREMASPGSVTGHPSSYYPCAGDWLQGYDVDDNGRATVAFIYPPCDCGYDNCLGGGDFIGYVTVGPRGGFRYERAY